MKEKLDTLTFFIDNRLTSFLQETQEQTRHVLTHEMKLKVLRNRFAYKKCTYPIKIVLFEGGGKLGFFDPVTFEIGLNKRCHLAKKESWLNIIRHELAHYIAFIDFGLNIPPHGKAFASVVKRYGFEKKVSKRFTSLEVDPNLAKKSEIQLKLQKLAGLSKSHHVEEAKSALNKMRQLVEKYQLDEGAWGKACPDTTFMIRALNFSRVDAKIKTIQSILRDFFVAPILNKGYKGGYLEVIGKRNDCEIADFVANFLNHKLNSLWQFEKKLHPHLKGLRAKNSFFLGISQGYFSQRKEKKETKHALAVIQGQISTMMHTFYPHLRTTRSSHTIHKQAYSQGCDAGKGLKIAKAIKTSFMTPLLTFRGK